MMTRRRCPLFEALIHVEVRLRTQNGCNRWLGHLQLAHACHGLQDDDEPDDFMEIPEGKVSLIIWLLCLPVYIPLYYTLLEPEGL